MDQLQAVLLFGGAFVVVGAVAITVAAINVFRTRRSNTTRDEFARAGSSDQVDAAAAGMRALGSAAWMRPGGGGL